ncbi:hypothetical protein GH714_012868 [Hevea brasiliensis]|uniref:Ternary complex factor MIP1 leucine-zipper domain-containing protein n=1 Tax=Hevea brasiliensis TaxID=3981 RepID=A0A6A6K6C7_HEVBR|nr:hypothetical protein GH714_012868 [Hevea brasiliensis]
MFSSLLAANDDFVEMWFEGVGDNKMLGLIVTPRHKRSKSFPDKKRFDEDAVDNSFEASHRIGLDMGHLKDSVKAKKKQSPKTEVEISLKEEILQLEKRLQDQFEPATELIKEIALLELEVVHLEQHLLSLYRKAFGQQISSVSPSSKYERSKSPVTTPRGRSLDVSRPDTMPKRETSAVQSGCGSHDNPCKESSGIGGEEKLLDSGVHRCHSSLSQRSAFPTRTSPPEESLGRAVRACHSQPLSMMEVT